MSPQPTSSRSTTSTVGSADFTAAEEEEEEEDEDEEVALVEATTSNDVAAGEEKAVAETFESGCVAIVATPAANPQAAATPRATRGLFRSCLTGWV